MRTVFILFYFILWHRMYGIGALFKKIISIPPWA